MRLQYNYRGQFTGVTELLHGLEPGTWSEPQRLPMVGSYWPCVTTEGYVEDVGRVKIIRQTIDGEGHTLV